MIRRGLPAFTVATRGMIYFHLELRTGERDLHSGIYGGAALNAAHALVQTLSAVIATDGRLAEPLRAGIVPPTEVELAGWRELPAGANELADQGARPADPTAAEEFYRRTFAEPALDINGVVSGSPDAVKTVIPSVAAANLSVRLAPGQQPEVIAAALERILREAAPPGAELTLDLKNAAPAGIVPADARAVLLGLDAFERALGIRPAADPLRRVAADRRGPGRARHPDDHHRVLTPRRQRPRPERAPARRVRPARDGGGEIAVRVARRALAVAGWRRSQTPGLAIDAFLADQG